MAPQLYSPTLSSDSLVDLEPKARPRNLCAKVVLGATVLILLLVALGTFIGSPISPYSSHRYPSISLSLSASPFSNVHFSAAPLAPSTCEPCLLTPEDPLCQYGIDSIRLSRAYEGSGYRVRKFLEKALRGEQVTIGIMGGSVSAGHGLEDGQMTWHDRFMDGFQEMFPNSVLYNGAVPESGSAFFSFCFESVLPQNLDLYIVEMDVSNDASMFTLRDDDQLFRGLLQLPQEPAVIRASIPTLAQGDMIQGRMSTLLLGQFFDIPVISIANPLLTHLMDQPDARSEFFTVEDNGDLDLQHVSHSSHQFLGDMMTLYFQKQVCETKRRLDTPRTTIPSKWPQEESLGKVPRLRVWDKYSEDAVVPPVRASCRTIGSTYHDLSPIAGLTIGEWRIDDFSGRKAWSSKKVGSYISFPFTGTSVGVFVWTSGQNATGLLGNEALGKADCWVDNRHMRNVTVDGYRKGEKAGMSKFWKVREGLAHGNHTVSCLVTPASTSGGHYFRLVGVASQ